MLAAGLVPRYLSAPGSAGPVRRDGGDRRSPGTGRDEIITVMGDSCAGWVDALAEERLRAALTAPGAGMPSPPSKALMVEVLAGMRRAVAVRQADGRALGEWLAGEIRIRGIRANAAVLAVLELPGRREEAARVYSREHPDRAGVLSDLLAVLDRSARPSGTRPRDQCARQ